MDPRPFTQDHDILIAVKTTLDLLYRDFQDLKSRTNEALQLKADKSEVSELGARMERDMANLSGRIEGYQKEMSGKLDRFARYVWVGVGLAMAAGIATPIVFQFVKH